MDIAAGISFLVAFGAGLISFLSPCVLPLVPSYVSVISGASYEELRGLAVGRNTLRKTVFINSVLFTLGFSVVFVVLGTSATLVGQALGQYQGAMLKVGGVLIILFGFYLMGILKPLAFLREFRLLRLTSTPVGVLGPFLVGLSFGLGWTPCIGPTLGAILTLASGAESLVQGTSLLAVYAAGLAVPFLLSAVAFNAFLTFFRRFSSLMPTLQKVGGVVLVAMGMLLFTGYLTVLNTYAIALTPQWLWGWL
jgi:cytochrome c-type biogenesis protein